MVNSGGYDPLAHDLKDRCRSIWLYARSPYRIVADKNSAINIVHILTSHPDAHLACGAVRARVWLLAETVAAVNAADTVAVSAWIQKWIALTAALRTQHRSLL